jgi:hypothetical protein
MAIVVLALAAACGRKDPGGSQGPRPAGPEASDQPAVLATVPAEADRPAGEPALGMALHSPVASETTFTFGELGGGVAFVVEAGDLQRVIHNGKAGKKYAAVGGPAVSRDGRRCAYGALIGGKWRIVLDGVEGDRAFDAIAGPVFSLDGAHLAFQAMDGERWYLVVDGKPNQGTETRYLQHELSADGSKIAFLEAFEGQERGRAYVSDVAFTGRTQVATDAASLVVSTDRARVAAVEADADGVRLAIVSFARPERVRRGARYRAISNPALGADDAPPVYVAERAGRQFAVLGDGEKPLPEGHLIGPLLVGPGGTSFAALRSGGRGRARGRGGGGARALRRRQAPRLRRENWDEMGRGRQRPGGPAVRPRGFAGVQPRRQVPGLSRPAGWEAVRRRRRRERKARGSTPGL